MTAPQLVDLHTHSNASDGSLDPADVVRLAARHGLVAVALTDHDTLDGLPSAIEAASEFPHLRFLPGVEMSAAFPSGTLHLLGLGIDPRSPDLRTLCERLRAARNERNPRMAARLREIGLDVSLDEATALAAENGSPDGKLVVSRGHFAQLLMRKGYVRSIQEAFEKYIGPGKPGYVPKERVRPAAAASAIHSAGGAVVLAHPVHLKYDNRAQLERQIRSLRGEGVDAIECYHSEHSPAETRMFLDLARRLGMGVSGGSDFHGRIKPHVRVGLPRVPLAALTGEVARVVRER